MPLNGDTINADKLSGIDEESDIYEGFSPHVDRAQVILPDISPASGKMENLFCPVFFSKPESNHILLLIFFCFRSLIDSDKKPALKTFEEIQTLLSQGKKREVKLLIRENAWPINSTIRSQLWPAVCSQHQVGKSMLEGYYWDMVNQASTNIDWKTETNGFDSN